MSDRKSERGVLCKCMEVRVKRIWLEWQCRTEREYGDPQPFNVNLGQFEWASHDTVITTIHDAVSQ